MRPQFLCVIYVVLSAVFGVWGHVLLIDWPISWMVLCAFLPVVAGSATYGIIKGTFFQPLQKRFFRDLLAVNFATALTWLSTFAALSAILPASFATLSYGMVPVVTLFVDMRLRKKKVSKREGVATAIISIGIIFTSWAELSLRAEAGFSLLIGGIVLSLMTAIFVSFHHVFSKRLNDQGVTANQVFQHRFWMILAATSLWNLGVPVPDASLAGWIQVSMLGLIVVVLAVYCLQHAIQMIGPRVVGFVFPLVPVVTLALQLLVGIQKEINFLSILGPMMTVLGVFLAYEGSFFRIRKPLGTPVAGVRA